MTEIFWPYAISVERFLEDGTDVMVTVRNPENIPIFVEKLCESAKESVVIYITRYDLFPQNFFNIKKDAVISIVNNCVEISPFDNVWKFKHLKSKEGKNTDTINFVIVDGKGFWFEATDVGVGCANSSEIVNNILELFEEVLDND